MINLNKIDFLNALFQEDGIDQNSFSSVDLHFYLSRKISSFRYNRFKYIDSVEVRFSTGDLEFSPQPFIILSSGQKLTLSKINRRLRNLRVGDSYQIEAKKALEFYLLNRLVYDTYI